MFLVVFRNRKRVDIDQTAYDAEAERMEALARGQSGYRSFKSYAGKDGEVIALSEWDSAEAARAWGREAEHIAAQARGRGMYYESYTLFACDGPQVRSFKREAP
ncbi:MAG: antibiotic biosynthesis monooxygenase [Novosphingobium sp.]